MSINEILGKIDEYKACIDAQRPLNIHQIKQLDEYFRINLTYSSNALEGNSLTISETKVILEDGLTIDGKPLREHFEAVGHSDAYYEMLKLARGDNFKLTEDVVLNLHNLFYHRIDLDNAGVYRNIDVIVTGTTFTPPKSQDIPNLMSKFISDFNEIKNNTHPVALAGFAHLEFVNIHPFVDGNGRVARLLMNLILVNTGYQILIIPPAIRSNYIASLRKASEIGQTINFYEFIADCELTSQKEYCRLLNIPSPI